MALEPGALLAKEIASPIVKFAIARATKLLDRGEKANEADVARLLQCLEAARVAVWGLGQEREAILSHAANCDLVDDKQVQALTDRLEQYLRQNNLRPVLERAIERLRLFESMAAKRNKPALYWPFRDKDRDAALQGVKQQLTILVGFLDSLGDRLRLSEPSGIGATQLLQVEDALKGHRKIGLQRAVATARGQETREWLDMTLEMETVVANLEDAFR